MVEQAMLDKLKNYFRKLRKLIAQEADINLIKYKLIKKAKIDDVLCCIISSFPEQYKKALVDRRQKLTSVIAYNYLYTYLKKKFFLSSDYYIVKTEETLKYIDAIILSIAKDIQWVENHEF